MASQELRRSKLLSAQCFVLASQDLAKIFKQSQEAFLQDQSLCLRGHATTFHLCVSGQLNNLPASKDLAKTIYFYKVCADSILIQEKVVANRKLQEGSSWQKQQHIKVQDAMNQQRITCQNARKEALEGLC